MVLKKLNIFILLLAQLLILFVSIRNIFPSNFIAAGADTVQFFNFDIILYRLNYTWANFQGEGIFLQWYSFSLYYHLIQMMSYILDLSPSQQSFIYYFFFLTGSFSSFLISLYLFPYEHSFIYKSIFSLIYIFNIYVFYNFYHTWGYSPFPILFILIPLIFAATYEYFVYDYTTQINRSYALLGILFFIANISFANLAFFVSLNVFLIIYIFLIHFNGDRGEIFSIKHFLVKILLFYGLMFFATCWSVIPQIIEMTRIISVFSGNQAFISLQEWILWQAVNIYSLYFLLFDIRYYAQHFSNMAYLAITFFLIPVLFILFNGKIDKLSLSFLFLTILNIALASKFKGIFDDDLIIKIFNNPILGSLRSHEKIIIFLPFFLLILTYFNFRERRYFKIMLYIMLALNILSVYPLFTGEMQTKYSVTVDKDKGYLNSDYSLIVKIPQDYYNLADSINGDKLNYKLYAWPYSVEGFIGWTYFPKWKLGGSDPTFQLFNAPIIMMNAPPPGFGKWNYGLFWNRQDLNASKWILRLSSLFNVKYVIYHKDISEKFITQTSFKPIYYSKLNIITQIASYNCFDLYKINSSYFLPIIYTPKTIVISKESVNKLPDIIDSSINGTRIAIFFEDQNQENLDLGLSPFLVSGNLSSRNRGPFPTNAFFLPSSINNNIRPANLVFLTPFLEFKKINPTKYRIRVHNATRPFPVVFSESFHEGWNAYASTYQETTLSKNGDYHYNSQSDDDQADRDEIKEFIDKGWITTLGNNAAKGAPIVDFISKNFQDTIQNENLPDGIFYETWFKTPLDHHLVVNGFSNAWIINPNELYKDNKCKRNKDGSYDFEIIIEFLPQQLYYFCISLSLITLALCIFYILCYLIKKKLFHMLH